MSEQTTYLFNRLCHELKRHAQMGLVSQTKHRSLMREVKEMSLTLTDEGKNQLSFYYLHYCMNVEMK